MSLASRVRKLETDLNPEKDRLPMFRVRRFLPGEWLKRYAIYRAKAILGLLTPSEIRRKGFVGHERHKGVFEDMTQGEARDILQQHGEVPV